MKSEAQNDFDAYAREDAQDAYLRAAEAVLAAARRLAMCTTMPLSNKDRQLLDAFWATQDLIGAVEQNAAALTDPDGYVPDVGGRGVAAPDVPPFLTSRVNGGRP